MTIVIGCDSFLALRNVRNGNLGTQLAPHAVHVWVDPAQLDGSVDARPDAVTIAALEPFDARSDPRLRPLLRRSNQARKSYYDPRTRWVKLQRSAHRRNRRHLVARLASTVRAAFGLASHWLAGRVGLAQRWRQRVASAIRAHPVADRYRQRLRDADATLVAGFSTEGPREIALLETANALGIPTAIMIRSRDNLASKIPHLPDAHLYIVWSDTTREFLLHMYPEIPRERVHVTGSPQFDRHLNPAFRFDREDFFDRIGLDPERPLVVYTMATPGLIDHETDIVQHLADAAHADALANRAQLLVRGHPRMFGSDVRLLTREYAEAKCYPRPTAVPYRSAEHESRVVGLILDDEAMHLATLAYQDVQVNVCGTMTIDSAILDKPTVHVYYDLVTGVPAGMSVREFYKRSDVREMLAYGAARLARTPDECVSLINTYLENPDLDADGRQRAREHDCGPLDGQAGRRISDLLAAVAGARTPSQPGTVRSIA